MDYEGSYEQFPLDQGLNSQFNRSTRTMEIEIMVPIITVLAITICLSCVCCIIYVRRKRQVGDNDVEQGLLDRSNRKSSKRRSRSQSRSRKDRKSSRSSSRASSRSTRSKEKKRRSKKKRKDEVDTLAGFADMNDTAFSLPSSLEGPVDDHGRPINPQGEPPESIPLLNETQKEVLNAFVELLRIGIKVKIYTGGKKFSAKLWLESPYTIQWKAKNILSSIRKKKKDEKGSLDVADISNIEKGKNTVEFGHATCSDVPEDTCLSLISQDSSIDIQVNSPKERDAMVQGFVMMMADLRTQQQQQL